MKNKNPFIKPFIKWVGGKRQLLSDINKVLPKNISVYCEPFIGGGAVFLNLTPKKAIVNDVNHELINLYTVVKEHPQELIENLKIHENTEEYFYDIRNIDRDINNFKSLTTIQKASRILYLNKTCYNGLFRVNNSGEFNAPYGRYKNPNIIDETVINAVSAYLNKNDITILCGDYQKSLESLPTNAFVYFDPPYDPVSDSSSFTGYTKNGFDRAEQLRLKAVCDTLTQKKIKFLLSNSATSFIKDTYKEYTIDIVNAKRAINSKGTLRGNVEEVLIRNYE